MKKQDFENLLEGIKQVGQIQREELAPGRSFTFHRPHPEREAKRYQVKDAREFLTKAGVKP